jgi:predicted RNA methylase
MQSPKKASLRGSAKAGLEEDVKKSKRGPAPQRQPQSSKSRPENSLPRNSAAKNSSPRNSSSQTQEADTPAAAPGWLLQCPPGLSEILKKELNFLGAIARDQKIFVKMQRNHDLVFLNHVKKAEVMDKVRIAETVLRCPVYGRFKISQRQLGIMADEMKALGPRRLVVTVAGRRFERHDLARWVTSELAERGYEFNEKIEDEVWMFCIEETWYFGIPVHKSRMTSGRDDRESERRGSLPPPIAAAMAFASMPKSDDVVLDPTCGSGTLLSEFHAYQPGARLTGLDIDPDAISVAKKNLRGVAHAKLIHGDSTRTEFSEKDVTLILANLPFGVQFGSKQSNASLYRDILRNVKTACSHEKPWRAVLLTSDVDSMHSAVRELAELSLEVLFKVKIRGELATAFRVKAK